MFEFLEVITPGCGASWQDAGRPGWKRFGVPPGGWMDGEAAHAASRLLGNPEEAVVLELALQGARFRVRQSGWLAASGASMGWAPGTTRRVERGDVLNFTRHQSGVYAYLAAPGGWIAPEILGSAAVSARSGWVAALTRGMFFPVATIPRGIVGRRVKKAPQRNNIRPISRCGFGRVRNGRNFPMRRARLSLPRGGRFPRAATGWASVWRGRSSRGRRLSWSANLCGPVPCKSPAAANRW